MGLGAVRPAVPFTQNIGTPYLKILNLSQLFIADANMTPPPKKKKIYSLSEDFKVWACIRGLRYFIR